jgi:hypothetical protein
MNLLLCLIIILNLGKQELQETQRLAPKYQAQRNVVLEDNTICDLVNEKYAIEIDYADKWYEAIGQSLHYAAVTEKQPAIILLLRNPETEWKYLVRCATVCGKHGIKLYVEKVD